MKIKTIDEKNLSVVLENEDGFFMNIIKASSVEANKKGWIIYWKNGLKEGVELDSQGLLVTPDCPVNPEVEEAIKKILKLAEEYDSKKIDDRLDGEKIVSQIIDSTFRVIENGYRG